MSLLRRYQRTARNDALEKVRLRNISLRTTLKKLERTHRAREQLADGLHMIDFEQLKIENQTLHEKIEERNEELTKLKRKKTVTVQVLTHVREKLRFYEKNNRANQTDLNELEVETMKLRAEVMTGTDCCVFDLVAHDPCVCVCICRCPRRRRAATRYATTTRT